MVCDACRDEDGEEEIARLDCAIDIALGAGRGCGEGGTEFKSGAMDKERPYSLEARDEGMKCA